MSLEKLREYAEQINDIAHKNSIPLYLTIDNKTLLITARKQKQVRAEDGTIQVVTDNGNAVAEFKMYNKGSRSVAEFWLYPENGRVAVKAVETDIKIGKVSMSGICGDIRDVTIKAELLVDQNSE